ncbi:YolD-like family protein [Brevibacillus massiliensis]|uniref:YolD-like family protein n=1 Tax=Brevibacillus massiliensis TaxID=1118054 RepID=UPI001FDF9ECB|nr:YolD-like family protein [Brevibacillus massiliensis]
MRDKPTSKKENLFAASRFVLPEHRELYLRIKAEEARYIPPTLDDEQRAELSEQVWQAFRDKCSVTVTFFDGRMMQRHAGIIATSTRPRAVSSFARWTGWIGCRLKRCMRSSAARDISKRCRITDTFSCIHLRDKPIAASTSCSVREAVSRAFRAPASSTWSR